MNLLSRLVFAVAIAAAGHLAAVAAESKPAGSGEPMQLGMLPKGQPVAIPQDGLVHRIQSAPRRTYLVNGLVSAVPFIGYGMRNLSKKAPHAKLFSYMTGVEGDGVIRPGIIKDATEAYAANPNVRINLIGISYGANMITRIAETLASRNVPVNYLGIIDGTDLRPIRTNVAKVDNFICTNTDCTREPVRLAAGNTVTVVQTIAIKSSHIPLGDNDQLHARVLAHIR